jgi:hypothetical protein
VGCSICSGVPLYAMWVHGMTSPAEPQHAHSRGAWLNNCPACNPKATATPKPTGIVALIRERMIRAKVPPLDGELLSKLPYQQQVILLSKYSSIPELAEIPES